MVDARIKTFTDGDSMSTVDSAWATAVQDQTQWKRGDGAAADAWAGNAGDGGLHRVALVAQMQRPADGTVLSKVIDASTDWRDRLVVILHGSGTANPGGFSTGFSSGFGPTNRAGAGIPDDGNSEFKGASGIQLGWLGDGEAQGQLTSSDYHIELTEAPLVLIADATTGHLILEMRPTVTSPSVHVAVMVHASEAIAEHTSPTAVPVPVFTGDIDPIDLNAIQDGGMLVQVNSGRQDIDSQAYPLGPLSNGQPRIPLQWRQSRRDGVVNPVTGDAYQRQEPSGSIRRIINAQTATAGDELVSDDDFRDRLVYFAGRVDTAAYDPGDANDDLYNAKTEIDGFVYVADGKARGIQPDVKFAISLDGTADLVLHVDEATGGLYLRNDTGSTQFVVGQIMASFKLTTQE